MVSYVLSVFNYFFPQKNEDEEDDERDNFLAEQLLELEINEREKENLNDTVSVPVVPMSAECLQRTGLISYISDNNDYVLIDGMFYYDITASPLNFDLKDQVLYLCYKDANESIVVVRILENQGMYWGEDGDELEESSFKVIQHVIIGEVDSRRERLVYMKDNDLKFSLDDVEATFIPVKGDWLELKCNVQFNEDKPSVSGAQVLQVVSFKALRRKVKSAVITYWSNGTGTCDKNIYFDRQSLQSGEELEVGYKVMVEAIESNQGICTWRVIKLIVTESVKSINSRQPDEYNASLDVEKEKYIDMTYPLKFENVELHHAPKLSINITNNSDQVYVMNKWIVLNKRRDSQIDIKPFLSRPMKLYPKQTFYFTATCYPKFLGNSRECFIIMFKDFQLKRFLEINVVDNSLLLNNITNRGGTAFKTQTEKLQMMRDLRNNKADVVPGVELIKPPPFVPIRLGAFPIPDRVWSAVLGDSAQTLPGLDHKNTLDRLEASLPCLCQYLNIHNYIDKWHTLLYMEEIEANISIRAHDMPKAFLIQSQEYLGVEIAGLAEKRPSLIVGDQVVVKDVCDENSRQYQGIIHAIKRNLVLMKFNPQFHMDYSGTGVSLKFHFLRSPYRRAHQAINLALSNLGAGILFPTRISSRTPQLSGEKIKTITWFNDMLNAEQKSAVTNILFGEYRPMPYCIFGPPGTGKTVTVIETILQILTNLPDSRILIATPSNSAANLIAERLIKHRNVFSDSVIRLLANYLIDSDTIPEIIKPFCATMDITREVSSVPKCDVKNGIQLNCQSSFIGRHRVTIGTCSCLGTLAQLGLPKGHFTHIIVDEACQATEPEIMIPMTFVDKENAQIILAGDPMQLGPVVLSRYAKKYGMAESYLSRILETYPYHKDFVAFKNGCNSKLVTKLVDNYRSLPEILQLPSQMFYDASLVAKLDRNAPWISEIIDVVSGLFDLESKTGGIYVYGVRGYNTRAIDSPSWFNAQEAAMVSMTMCKLYKKNIKMDDIGIITPYLQQIKHLRLLFAAIGLPIPKIGTVEDFQGQERPVIMISTVRSSESHLQEDFKHTLGFVKNPKRLNVALTRAQVAVILFCDPHLLNTDSLWGKVIASAISEKKYIGCNLPSVYDKPINKN